MVEINNSETAVIAKEGDSAIAVEAARGVHVDGGWEPLLAGPRLPLHRWPVGIDAQTLDRRRDVHLDHVAAERVGKAEIEGVTGCQRRGCEARNAGIVVDEVVPPVDIALTRRRDERTEGDAGVMTTLKIRFMPQMGPTGPN